MKKHRKLAVVFLALAVSVPAQNVSSSVRGTITDSTGAAVVNADCALTNQATAAALAVKSGGDGGCIFPSVLPGAYTLTVKATGFRGIQTKDIVVTSGQIRSLGQLTLEVGEVRETISVTAEVARIQLSSAEKSGSIDNAQLQNIAVKGRDFFALLNTVPGVVDNFSQARETSSPDSIRGTFINGQRENQKNLAIDGITDLDTGSNSTVHFQPNMDSISEIKVLTSNYQAEFGRNGGGVITVITKGGAKDFHGTGYWFYRHESLNANSFFNNRNGTPKNPYRYRINGYTIGGPVFIPKVFNTGKDKLFFFWSQEYVGMKRDYGTRWTNMPTQLERDGDYSQSFDSAGRLIALRDPLTNASFPGNLVPKSRFNAMGLKMLNFFPLPNWRDPDPREVYNRNYRAQYSGAYPKRQDMVRIDANVSPSLQVYYRFIKDKDEQTVPWGLWVNGNLNYDLTPTIFGQPGKGHNFHLTKMFSPTLINEFIFGKSRNNLYFYPLEPEKLDRGRIGNPPEWYKDSATGVTYLDKVNYIPNLTFGGNPNPVTASFGNIPYENYNNIWSFVDNVSKVAGSHNIKAGVYIERTQKYQVGGGNNRGAFNFARSSNNPLDANHGYANALLGNFNSYSEATARVNGDWWFWNFEWFVQDNWRVSKRLTLDAGVRFYRLPPQTDKNDTIAGFDPLRYGRAKAPALYMPALDSANRRVAMNPLNGQLAAAQFIGLFVPGSGDFANGAFVGGTSGYPKGLYSVPSLAFGPRLGFAYDVFGNGKTAIRGGFGMFKDRMQGNPTMNTNGNPPVAYSPTLSFGQLDTYAGSPGALGPSGINSLFGKQKLSSTMNFSLGLQQQVGAWALDASYVGGLSRNLMASLNINPIPMYARFVDRNPQNADPTNRSTPLADNFLRPYYGWADINYRSNGYSSNYNSLQLAANRRYSSGLQVGVAYTFSKTLGVADGDTSGISPYFSPRQRNYGPAGFDRPHVFVANYIYDVPKIGSRTGFKPAGWVLDNWQISGMTVLQSGSPFTPGFGLVRSEEWTGSAEGARVDVIANPNLPKSERTFTRWFNTAAFAMPRKGTFGNAGVNIMRNPGINNWDLSITKKVPLGGEQRWLQFRTELFNAWNHTQYSGMGTGTSFDNTTGAQTSPNFGVINGARPPRLIQLSLKVYF
ncbi:MAG: carboxypeptidase regulatory-like domain-containing protein [Acidobacteria bacterium]|nr:carboxypeptidase regulatory-like domain-containing protein [Acidobacteriota bacterium]